MTIQGKEVASSLGLLDQDAFEAGGQASAFALRATVSQANTLSVTPGVITQAVWAGGGVGESTSPGTRWRLSEEWRLVHVWAAPVWPTWDRMTLILRGFSDLEWFRLRLNGHEMEIRPAGATLETWRIDDIPLQTLRRSIRFTLEAKAAVPLTPVTVGTFGSPAAFPRTDPGITLENRFIQRVGSSWTLEAARDDYKIACYTDYNAPGEQLAWYKRIRSVNVPTRLYWGAPGGLWLSPGQRRVADLGSSGFRILGPSEIRVRSMTLIGGRGAIP